MTSLSSSYAEQIDTKYEAYRLIHDPTRLITLLFSKYGDIEEDFYFLYINQLIYNLPTKFNCLFKEIKFTNLSHDYLKRHYKMKECIERIPKLSNYYKNYHLFFCRPTLRHYKLSKLMCNFQDKKAEIFYKNNYKESKENISVEKEENNKKNSSFSFSSLDNITNNKIIFDKQTKKILDKSETELKNNNYYNTLMLETSRSNLLMNNGLISKRTGDESSFEKIIHNLVDYQYNKNKKKSNKAYTKSKKIKNIMINTDNSNRFSKIKYNISQSQRASHKFYSFKMYNNNSKVLNNKDNKINSNNTSNSNNYINKIIKNKNKNKKKSLYTLNNNGYNTSTTTLLTKNNNGKISNIKEFNINYPITTTNKDSNKNHTYIYSNNNTINNIGNNNNSNIIQKINSNSNYNTKSNTKKKNLKLEDNSNNNSKNFSKLTEYLKQIKLKENNLNPKNSLHKKNCLSIGDKDNKNLLFNLNNKKRITKKKITLNKNLKISITNGNINSNVQKIKHNKNKTFDYNSMNSTSNNLTKNNIVIREEYNVLLNKIPKNETYKIKFDINNFQNNQNKNNFSKINKGIKTKKDLLSPTNKILSKISLTQNSSKEKNNKKDLKVKIFSPNNKKRVHNKEINSPHHKKNNKSVLTNNSNTNKDLLIKSNKINKTNICLSPNSGDNNININNMLSKNIGNQFSPLNQLFNSIVYFKRNINQNSNRNNTNNIYVKKSINKDANIINNKKGNNNLINSCNFSNNNSNITFPNNNMNNNNYNISSNIDNKKLSRNNKKKFSNKNMNASKKSNIHTKTNSSVNHNPLNCNFIINENINLNNNTKNNNSKNINISIEKNNINIKDSILHIDKIYIKKENSNKKGNSKSKIYEIDDNSQNKKTIEIKVGNEIIKTYGNEIKIDKEKNKYMEYSPFKINYSPKVINVHRNFNLINKNNKEIKNKYK